MRNGVNVERMMKDLQTVARDAEELVKATAGEATEQVREARGKLSATLEQAEANYKLLEERAVALTGRTIRQHPFQTLGAAFSVGLLIGVLVNRGGPRA